MKTAIIFGHTSGLGLELTNQLIKKNYNVVGFARSACKLNSNLLINNITDLTSEQDINKAIFLIKSKYSSFDYLIYCAGTLTAHNIDNLNYSEVEKLYKINIFAPMIIESSLLKLIINNGSDVVNITSSALIDYYPKFAEYSSSKAALQKFTKDLQKELKETNSRVIEFCPSGFTSNIYKNMTGDKVNRDESVQMQAADVANILIFLLELPKKIEISQIYVNRK